MKVFFDFETRSLLDVKRNGADRYARDPSTSVLCMAYAIDDGPVELWIPEEPVPAWVARPKTTLVAHNAAFERAIWSHCLHWPPVELEHWDCSAARAAACGLPRSLEGAAEALGLPITKDKEGRRSMLRLTKPVKKKRGEPARFIAEAEEPLTFATCYLYCLRDVEVERAIYLATPSLHPWERELYLLDQVVNDRGVPIDRGTVLRLKATLERYADDLTRELAEATGGAVTSARQAGRLTEWLNAEGANVANVRKDSITTVLEDDDVQGAARRVCEIREQLGRSSISKLDAMLDRVDADDRLRGSHLYYGAATGRWAGRGVQLQNLPRGTVKADEIEPLIEAINAGSYDLIADDVVGTAAGLLRSMIAAPEGKTFFIVDFAQIEARVLAWLAGETQLLRQFARGEDVYRQFAARLYEVSPEEVSKEQRQVGKIAVLGLGYSMGAERFVELGASYRIEIGPDFAEQVVDTYRAAHGAIRRFWYAVGDAAIRAVRRPGVEQSVGRITYVQRGRFLECRLPSGRPIRYVDPEVREVLGRFDRMVPILIYSTVDSKTHRWVRRRSYGGLLTENIVQGVARDFLAEALFRLERHGYPVSFHVHDEVIGEVDENKADLRRVEELVSTVPAWGRGCPIAAEGFISRRYRK